jgi:hypothetical protein
VPLLSLPPNNRSSTVLLPIGDLFGIPERERSLSGKQGRRRPVMSVLPGDIQGADPVPAMPQPSDSNRLHTSSLSSSSSSSSDGEPERGRSRNGRPRMPSRKPSASILVPRDHPEIEIEEEEFPPDDARAMSPRRDSADVERLGKEARQTLQE